MKIAKIFALIAITLLVASAIVYPAGAVIDISTSFGGTTYTNLGNRFEITLNAKTKGNNSKKQSCGRTYMRIGAANMNIVETRIGNIPNSSITKEPDGTYVIQNSSKYDCIPDGDHLVATFVADTVITGNASIYSTNGTAMFAFISVNIAPKTVTVYPVLCPEGKTGTPPNCTVMNELNDICPNIGGIQTTVPEGSKKNEAGECVKVSTDVSDEAEVYYAPPKYINLVDEVLDKTGSIANVGYLPMIDSILLRWDMKNGLTEPKVQVGKVGGQLYDATETPKIENSSALISIDRLNSFTQYKVVINGKNAKGEDVEYSGVTRTSGYPIEIIVKQSGAVRSSAAVRLAGVSQTTDSYGMVRLEAPSGKSEVEVEIGGIKETHTIDVKNASINEATGAFKRQSFTIELAPPPSTPWWVFALVAGGVLLLVGAVVFMLIRKRRKSSVAQPSPIVDAPTPIGLTSPNPVVDQTQQPPTQPVAQAEYPVQNTTETPVDPTNNPNQ